MRKNSIFACGIFLAAGWYGFKSYNLPFLQKEEIVAQVPEEEIPVEEKVLFGAHGF